MFFRLLVRIFRKLKQVAREEKYKILHPTCKFGKNVYVDDSAIIGKNCKFGTNARIGKDVSLGNNIKIGANSVVDRACIGNNSVIEYGVIITGKGSGKISIGQDCYIGIGCYLDFSDNIEIGDRVHFAASTGVWTHSSAYMVINKLTNHELDESMRDTSPVAINSNVYVGANCVIYPGIKIGKHSIIAPCSAVAKNVQSRTMVGGVPAKFIKTIKNEGL